MARFCRRREERRNAVFEGHSGPTLLGTGSMRQAAAAVVRQRRQH
jgi:hypothetical protein